ncbi:sulfite exporter TauE/SafE family protein [Peribacillus sp. FSL E2-0218]|uniref:sulfite exporter TauE/SafE family protein n=1 Tax=Peribacillus sp. FSL E2-0218 TaxID=2921364 RepID=UPI0030EBD280
MDITFIMTIFLIGFIGSYISGMLGIGGAIINYPLLLFVPPIFGLAAFSAHDVTGISAVQVLFASIGGVWSYRKSGHVNKTLILYMGISVLIGSMLGSFGSREMSENGVNFVYGVLALIAAFMMFIPRKRMDQVTKEQVSFNKWLAAILALLVGLGAGIVGAGGGFLLVPIMLIVLRIPTRVTIASSLAITLISSIGATAGKITTGQVDFYPALIIVAASLIAAPIGAMVGKKMNVKVLQVLLALLILATAVKTWLGIMT